MLEVKVQDQAAEIKQCDMTTSELKRAIKDLNREMELKVHQILTIRRESTAQLQLVTVCVFRIVYGLELSSMQ